MLDPVIQKNDKAARIFIFTFSIIVFAAITALSRVSLNVDLPFSVHFFAKLNAVINSIVAFLLLAGLWMVRKQNYMAHKKIMLFAMFLSILFLLSYIAHHLLADQTRFGDYNHDQFVSDEEKASVGGWRTFYYILLLTHIPLAGIVLPFILFTAYRALTGEFEKHKKLSRYTWPVWFYVAVSGVVVYLMIQPFYVN